jgi:hypothetical protein
MLSIPCVMDSYDKVLILVRGYRAFVNSSILLPNTPLDIFRINRYASICLESSNDLLFVGDITDVLSFLQPVLVVICDVLFGSSCDSIMMLDDAQLV